MNKCHICNSKEVIKKGKNSNNKQRYFCKNCNKYFQLKVLLPSWVKKAYNDYVFNNMVLVKLSKKYAKSIKTILKYFDILNNKANDNNNKTNDNNKKTNERNEIKQLAKQPINLLFDGTFFKKKQRLFSI